LRFASEAGCQGSALLVIDFHTHVFPDELAERAVTGLYSKVNYYVDRIYSDGSLNGLISNMDRWGVDISVVQPIAIRKAHTKTVNLWAQSICSERIISFGSIAADTDDYKRDIDFVVSLGLKGLKFHPEYQDFIVDDIKMLRIYDYAISKGLLLLFMRALTRLTRHPTEAAPDSLQI
jgi:predicted TIM-barrel fold metal-dependent hydrolase